MSRIYAVAAVLISALMYAAPARARPSDQAMREIAQAASEDILVEEENPTPAGVKPDAAPPAAVPAQAKPASPTKAPAAQPPKTEARELLIEEGETPLVEEPPTVSQTPAVKPAPPSPLSPEAATQKTADSDQPLIEDGGLVEEEAVETEKSARRAAAKLTDASRAVVSESRSINFAENLQQYRSPKLAMLLSALVPGLGQAYCRNWWKAGAYLAVEVASIATSVGLYNKGKQIEKQAWRYADRHYSPDGFSAWYDSLWQALAQKGGAGFADSILKKEIFIFYDTAFDTAQFRALYEKRRSNSVFYNYIQDDNFIYGWEDAYPSLASFKDRVISPQLDTVAPYNGARGDTIIVSSPATGDSIDFKYDRYINGKLTDEKKYGFSAYYNTYRRILRERDERHRWAGYVLYVVVVNHVVSAIDAGITAKAYNDQLLGKQSFWQRIRVEPVWVDAGAGASLGAAVSLDF